MHHDLPSRRRLLLAGASAALSGCGLERLAEQPGRHIFRHHTLYRKWGAEIVAFTLGDSGCYSLEASTESRSEMRGLWKVDLDDGSAKLIRKVDGAEPRLAVSRSHAFIVIRIGREPYLHRISLTGTSAPERMFQIPHYASLVADAAGAWVYRTGRRGFELVRVTESAVEPVFDTLMPGDLTKSPHGLFFNTDEGLYFLPRDGKPTFVAGFGATPVVTGSGAMLWRNGRLFELSLPSGERGELIGDTRSVPGWPCAAMFGGVVFVSDASPSPSLLRDDDWPGGLALNFWEADTPGWDTAMNLPSERMVFGCDYGPAYLVATESQVISIF